MIFDAHDNYKTAAKAAKNYSSLFSKKETNENNDLKARLKQGIVKYENDIFTGTLPREVYDRLIKIGAKLTSKGLFIESWRLPYEYKQEIIEAKNESRATFSKYYSIIETAPTELDGLLLGSLSTDIFKRLSKNFSKANLAFKYNTSSIEKLLKKNIETRLIGTKTHLLESFLKLDRTLPSDVLEKKIVDRCKSAFNSSILNTINETLFDIQKTTAVDNNITTFYWWHRPTLRLSDRMFHRRHYEASKKGRKFSFLNLPIYNGEPDYPGKLYNCHCRAYITKAEFDRATE